MSSVAVVTGAAKGIGLELCRQLAARGDAVVACPRVSEAPELAALASAGGGRIQIVPMDVGDQASVVRAADEIGKRVDRIDFLFNNAAIYPKGDGGVESCDLDRVLDAFNVNSIGPLRVVRALLPLLRKGKGKRIAQVTSLMGSIADNGSGGSYAYRMSKAALNMATRNLAHELGGEGFFSLSIHPGWVQTRMGGEQAPLGLAAAVQDVLANALDAPMSASGGFRGPGGEPLPW